jgi:vacuolar-type H+-ATPase catalytic subunit A/Vma1
MQVRVGHENLMGEVIRIEADRASIQVYEETGMLHLNTTQDLADLSQLVSRSATPLSGLESRSLSSLVPVC